MNPFYTDKSFFIPINPLMIMVDDTVDDMVDDMVDDYGR